MLTNKETIILSRLARARGLSDSLANPIVAIKDSREGSVEEIAKEISSLLEEASNQLFAERATEDD